MTQLYLTPLPNADTDDSASRARRNVSQQGKIEASGTAVENIATDSSSVTISGRFELGPTLARKLAREVDSMSESQFAAVPLVDDTGSVDVSEGYYEVTETDVEPAHPITDAVYTFDVTLTPAGTTEQKQREIATNEQPVNTGLATGDPGTLGIPAAATRVKWYKRSQSPEPASPVATVTTEFGDVDQYRPDDAPFEDPNLIYDLPLREEYSTDVRVYDDEGRSKFATTADGDEVNVWVHAFDTGFEFNGNPVIDNGRIRLRLGDDVTAEEYDAANDVWSSVTLDSGDLELEGWTITGLSPTETSVLLTATDTSDGSVRRADVAVQRGLGGVLLRQPPDDTLSTKYESWFDPISVSDTTDTAPKQRLSDRVE